MPEAHAALVFEGIEPQAIGSDILDDRLPLIYDLIFRDFPANGSQRFSDEFMHVFKSLIGELFSSLAECLRGGMSDLENIFRFKVKQILIRLYG